MLREFTNDSTLFIISSCPTISVKLFGRYFSVHIVFTILFVLFQANLFNYFLFNALFATSIISDVKYIEYQKTKLIKIMGIGLYKYLKLFAELYASCSKNFIYKIICRIICFLLFLLFSCAFLF